MELYTSTKIRKLSETPNCIELYKQKGYVMQEETKDYILFRKKIKIWEWFLCIIIAYWIGVLVYQTPTIGTLLFIGYPIMQYLNKIKVMKNE